jgi:2-keto-4-pentenoate hydratase/2-oxohepta-3-ene-1,7-dioic acid hydratase in catechol pathway
MKLVSFLDGERASYGIVQGEEIIDVGKRLGGRYPTLASAVGALSEVNALADTTADLTLNDVTLLPPITDPGRIVCVGLNYRTHIEETGRDTPTHPILFSRYANSHVAHGQPMIRPKVSEHFDFEGELAFVVGKPGRHISQEDALSHVAGYACYNDGSVRDFQHHTSQFMPGKNFWHSGAFGPWLVTADELPDPGAMTLQTRLNGAVVQDATTDDLLFGIPELIEYMSKVWPLAVGDVIATGTTGGVGAARKPPLWMKAGDRVEVEISGIGTLSNPIEDE